MAKRGPKSAADLSVVKLVPKGPKAPPGMTDAQTTIWNETVEGEPEEFFQSQGARHLLKDYCRHRAAADLFSGQADDLMGGKSPDGKLWVETTEGCKRIEHLLKLRDAEVRSAANLAVKLRMTNQSRYTPHKAATAATNKPATQNPWD